MKTVSQQIDRETRCYIFKVLIRPQLKVWHRVHGYFDVLRSQVSDWGHWPNLEPRYDGITEIHRQILLDD